jgi:integral membrane sensor domain MASE1
MSPVILQHIHDALFSGVHLAFVAALAAAIIGTVVVSRLPGGSALEHQAAEG